MLYAPTSTTHSTSRGHWAMKICFSSVVSLLMLSPVGDALSSSSFWKAGVSSSFIRR